MFNYNPQPKTTQSYRGRHISTYWTKNNSLCLLQYLEIRIIEGIEDILLCLAKIVLP